MINKETELASIIRMKSFDEADRITVELILAEFETQDIRFDKMNPKVAMSKIPSQFFINIDKIWMNETDGLYGFSRQACIYQACNKNWDQFCISIGWMNEKSLIDGLIHGYEMDKYKLQIWNNDFKTEELKKSNLRFENWAGQYPLIIDKLTILFHDTWLGDPISIQKYLMNVMANYYGEKMSPMKSFWIE